MKTVSMSGSPRENVGKKDAKKHRREGNVPSVLYGGEKQIHFTVNSKEFSKIIFTPEVYLINLKVGTESYHVILQEVQYHPVTDEVLHVDFREVIPGKPVVVGLPIKIEGSAPGVLKGGKLVKKLNRLKVKGLVDHLPERIVVSIEGLDIGDSIRVRDLNLSNLEFLDPASSEVVGVRTARAAVTAAEETAGAETAATAGETGEPAPEAKPEQ